jgi:hypothetical protein
MANPGEGNRELSESSLAEEVRREIATANLLALEENYTDTSELWETLQRLFWKSGGGNLPSTVPDLDELVHELHAEEASNVNNEGIRGQLEYLYGRLGRERFQRILEGKGGS